MNWSYQELVGVNGSYRTLDSLNEKNYRLLTPNHSLITPINSPKQQEI